jgi:sugar/nucleoside kinase (ribokinase family)
MGKVLAVGNGTVDILVKAIDELDFVVDSHQVETITMSTGGDTANASINMAKMGVDVDIVCLTATDSFGNYLYERLENMGVGVQYAKRIDGVQGSCTLVIINSEGDRTFYGRRGINLELTVDDIDFSVLPNYQLALVNNFFIMPTFHGEGSMKFLKAAQEAGVTTAVDMAWDRSGKWMEVLGPNLPYIDYFLPSFVEAKALTGGMEEPEKMCDFFLEHGAKNVVIKLGEEGSYFKNAKEKFHMPAFKIKPVDTTGAGDAFVGGFMTGLSNGWDIRKTMLFATGLSGKCCTFIGTTTETPDMDGIWKFIEENEQNPVIY